MLLKQFLFIVLMSLSLHSFAADKDNPFGSEIDLDQVAKDLPTKGIQGWVHGANKGLGLYIFTLRDPKNFFDYELFPMVTESAAVQKQMENLKRHDLVWLKGEFIDEDKMPLGHIDIWELKVVKPYEGDSTQHDKEIKIPDDFPLVGEKIVKVHAVAAGGRVLVVEDGDLLLPVFVRDYRVTQNLYRNDKILLRYVVRKEPNAPVHLAPDRAFKKPVEVMERIEDGHGTQIQLTGSLVMFPKSPQLIFNVFALQDVDADNIERNYTLVNFKDPDVFKKIREKLQAAWTANKATMVKGRNKFVNPKIQVTAKGMKNVISPSQANPQILLDSADDITFTFK